MYINDANNNCIYAIYSVAIAYLMYRGENWIVLYDDDNWAEKACYVGENAPLRLGTMENRHSSIIELFCWMKAVQENSMGVY